MADDKKADSKSPFTSLSDSIKKFKQDAQSGFSKDDPKPADDLKKAGDKAKATTSPTTKAGGATSACPDNPAKKAQPDLQKTEGFLGKVEKFAEDAYKKIKKVVDEVTQPFEDAAKAVKEAKEAIADAKKTAADAKKAVAAVKTAAGDIAGVVHSLKSGKIADVKKAVEKAADSTSAASKAVGTTAQDASDGINAADKSLTAAHAAAVGAEHAISDAAKLLA